MIRDPETSTVDRSTKRRRFPARTHRFLAAAVTGLVSGAVRPLIDWLLHQIAG